MDITPDKLGWPARPEIVGKHFSERDFSIDMSCLTLSGGPRNYTSHGHKLRFFKELKTQGE